ncbi:acyl-CoA thioesterase [Nocardioides nematodiphilus]|uniref:acyl-CoA thioesterase n=1 Tax=Nocardioides nematodiphilus TaxID=2849669 RepID=UPI001CD9222A|nr:acyl-CoA thioesterase domain-containing protein [Nocardioides nematodiphilus]MCA1983507.1 thioesterase family protein [Nocardioides nematodiphilus]
MTTEEQRVLGVPLHELVALLDLEQLGADEFRGQHTTMSAQINHVFGGLVAAQALVAAGRTVPADRLPHSLHAYFLRPGDHRLPLELHVTRTRDGGSLSHRRISVEQQGSVIAELSGSFALPSDGPEHHPDPVAATTAQALSADHELLAAIPGMHPAASAVDAFELRTVGLAERLARQDPPAEVGDPRTHRLWFRTPVDAAPLGDDPLLHAALLLYATDLRILQPVLRPHGIVQMATTDPVVLPATIDHTVWFHAPVRVDQWLLLDAESPWAAHGRGLVRAEIFTSGGELAASVAQEAMVRYRR